MAGATVPMLMTRAVASNLIDSASMVYTDCSVGINLQIVGSVSYKLLATSYKLMMDYRNTNKYHS